MTDFSNIKIINNSAYVPTVYPKYVVLGLLDEYWGRRIFLSTPLVERFYPSENELVREFCNWFTRWGEGEKKEINFKVETLESGHINVYSYEAANLLAECYPHSLDNTSTYADHNGNQMTAVHSKIQEQMFPEFKRGEYSRESTDSRFSYLLGCHIRYGKGNLLYFANAPHKVDLILKFLVQLECEWLQQEWTPQTAPVGTTIRFKPTPALNSFLSLDSTD